MRKEKDRRLCENRSSGLFLFHRVFQFSFNERTCDGKGLDAAFGQSDLGFAAGRIFSLQSLDGLLQLVQSGVDLPFGLQ